MPKDVKHVINLKSQRLKGKVKSQKYSPGTVSVQVLGSGAKGAPRSLYVFTDHSRYLFNCGEGTQRLSHEHKMKLSKLEHIFITYPCWDNLGGLPGVALTIQDVGVPEITLHGPDGVDDIFTATRRFVVLKNMTVSMADSSEGNWYQDSALRVNYIPLINSQKLDHSKKHLPRCNINSLTPEDDIDYYAYARGNSVKKKKMNVGRESMNKNIEAADVAMCYICKIQPRPGALCLDKCVEFGVPPGPLLGKLKSGEDVVLDDGRIVRSNDVTLPDDPGPVFIVLEVPTEDFLPALERKAEVFSKYQMTADSDDNAAFVVVHFTPPHIMAHPIYMNFMKKFPLSCHHLLINGASECPGSVAIHKIQHKLNLLDSSVFPLLETTGITLLNENQITKIKEKKNDILTNIKSEVCAIEGRTLWRANLRPSRIVDSSSQNGLSMNTDEFIQEVLNFEGFDSELNSLKEKLLTLPKVTEEYPNIIFLGTGSCIPNKTRNTSGILLNLREGVCMLLDCGEGTWSQLYRYFGPSHIGEVLRSLKAVYISHLHADHHIGLIGVIKERDKVCRDDPLYLIAPAQIATWLNLYHNKFEPILENVELVPNTYLLYDSEESREADKNDEEKDMSIVSDVLGVLGLSKIDTCRVIHCPNSFGVSLTHLNGEWKITYSGDTMPSQQLIDIGKGSTVLIHEATMEDELEEEAKIKLHSTTSQAIEVGSKMDAHFILLTHFSQRYAKLPRIDSSFSGNVGIAFDNMKVRLSDLPKLPLFYPALKLMFQDECEELELKALKRQMKKERLERELSAS